MCWQCSNALHLCSLFLSLTLDVWILVLHPRKQSRDEQGWRRSRGFGSEVSEGWTFHGPGGSLRWMFNWTIETKFQTWNLCPVCGREFFSAPRELPLLWISLLLLYSKSRFKSQNHEGFLLEDYITIMSMFWFQTFFLQIKILRKRNWINSLIFPSWFSSNLRLKMW